MRMLVGKVSNGALGWHGKKSFLSCSTSRQMRDNLNSFLAGNSCCAADVQIGRDRKVGLSNSRSLVTCELAMHKAYRGGMLGSFRSEAEVAGKVKWMRILCCTIEAFVETLIRLRWKLCPAYSTSPPSCMLGVASCGKAITSSWRGAGAHSSRSMPTQRVNVGNLSGSAMLLITLPAERSTCLPTQGTISVQQLL